MSFQDWRAVALGVGKCSCWNIHQPATLGPEPEATYPGLPVRLNLPLAAVQATPGNDLKVGGRGREGEGVL